MATNATLIPQYGLTGSAAITASGTQTQAAGTAVTAQYIALTSGVAANAITLPVATPGQIILIQNLSANTATVFPPLTGALNRGTVNAGVVITASKWSTVIYTSTVDAAVVVA